MPAHSHKQNKQAFHDNLTCLAPTPPTPERTQPSPPPTPHVLSACTLGQQSIQAMPQLRQTSKHGMQADYELQLKVWCMQHQPKCRPRLNTAKWDMGSRSGPSNRQRAHKPPGKAPCQGQPQQPVTVTYSLLVTISTVCASTI